MQMPTQPMQQQQQQPMQQQQQPMQQQRFVSQMQQPFVNQMSSQTVQCANSNQSTDMYSSQEQQQLSFAETTNEVVNDFEQQAVSTGQQLHCSDQQFQQPVAVDAPVQCTNGGVVDDTTAEALVGLCYS